MAASARFELAIPSSSANSPAGSCSGSEARLATAYVYRFHHDITKHGLRGRIRTCGPSGPGRELYQTELHTENLQDTGTPRGTRTHNIRILNPTRLPIAAEAHEPGTPRGTRTHNIWCLKPARLPIAAEARKHWCAWRGSNSHVRGTLVSETSLYASIPAHAQKYGLERWFRFIDVSYAMTDLSQKKTCWCPEQDSNLHKFFVWASASCKRQRFTGLLHRREQKFGGCVGNRTPTVPALVSSFALMLLRLLTVHARSS